jgi:sterol desaturase/sphingolipid hydroxylase (fatty acid hydroxylase superfamily)
VTTPPPLERWLARAFGDVGGTHFGSGWISGTASVFLGALALLGVLGFWFPGALTSAAFRAHYPIPVLRALVNVTIGLAFLLGAVSLVLRRRKVLGLTGLALALVATLAGGGGVPIESAFDQPLFGWLGRVIATPRAHHWHHGVAPIDKDFAVHLPVLDLLFGTLHLPRGEWPAAYGIEGHPVPEGWGAQLVHPFRRDG